MKRSQLLVPRVKPRSRKVIESAASVFLARFAAHCLKTPTMLPVEQLFDQVLPRHYRFQPGIEVLPPGLLGLTDCGARTVTLAAHVHEALTQHDGSARFTTCHEIGHVVLHGPDLAKSKISFREHEGAAPVLARRSELPAYEDPEWQANTFSAALLMPSPMVMALLAKVGRPRLVPEMMRVFAVSREAAVRRLATIGRTTAK